MQPLSPTPGPASSPLPDHATPADTAPLSGGTSRLRRLEHVLDLAWNEVYVLDAGSLRYLQVNRQALARLGLGLEDMQALTPLDILSDRDREHFRHHVHELKAGGPDTRTFIARHRGRDGACYTVEYRMQYFPDESPPVFIAIARDITLREHAQDALMALMERAEATLSSIGDAVVTADADGNVDHLNPMAEYLTGWTLAQAQGRPVGEVFKVLDEHTHLPLDCPVGRCLSEADPLPPTSHAVLIRRDGGRTTVETTVVPIHDRRCRIVGAVLVFQEASDERALRDRITYQASHDELTGLPNRREFEQRLARAMEDAERWHRTHVLFYMDLDKFQVINDTLGHDAGDELLRQLARLLAPHLRNADTLARLGGDEFGVLLENCRLERALDIAGRFRDLVREFRFVWDGRVFEAGMSIGVVPLTPGMGNTGMVLAAADLACYAAKERGRNHIHVYRADDAELARRHNEMHWVSDLRQAMAEDRLHLCLQAILPLRPGPRARAHFEVLLRLRDPEGNMIHPGAFIPAAERYDLMPAMDRWVIRHALMAWSGRGQAWRDCGLAINLSGKSMNDEDLKDYILAQLREYRVAPRDVCFELTETAVVGNLAGAAQFMRELKSHGCRFALDDFGSGFSSFAYLKELPIDYLKIDGLFVKDMLEDPMHRALVESINHIGHVMGFQTIAEYVENGRLAQALKDIGVDYVQGYGIGHPQPMAQFCPQRPPRPEDPLPEFALA